MKTQAFLFSTLFFLLTTITLHAQDKPLYSNTIQKTDTFHLDPNFGLNISNTNGNVQIEFWDKDYVEYHTTIWAQGWEQTSVDEFIEVITPQIDVDYSKCKQVRISIDYKHLKNKCGCKNGNGRSTYKKWFKKISVQDFTINYKVFIPKKLQRLSVNNDYGNILLPNFKGSLHIFLKEGLLKADTLVAHANSYIGLIQAAANIQFLKAEPSHINFSYCDDIQINHLECSYIRSKKSKLHLGHIKCKKLNSTADSMRIQEAAGVTIQAAFSDIYIQKASNYLNINLTKSGYLYIDTYDKTFKELKFRGLYSSAFFNLNAKDYFVHTSLKQSWLDSKMFNANNSITKKVTMRHMFGNPKAKKRINLFCENCDIKL